MIDIQLLQKFIGVREVLVVDRNSISRGRLVKILPEFGVNSKKIVSCGTLSEALELVKKRNIGIVFSEYMIGGGSGFDLFQKIREIHSHPHELCFFLITSNLSQSTIGMAGESEVDSLIIKPYNLQSIQENLFSALTLKMSPSDYLLKVQEGKELISEGLLDEARIVLKDALILHPKPALALSLIGEIEYVSSQVSEAEVSFTKGLDLNEVHFRSLINLYQLYMREKKFHEAYKIVKKIIKFYPGNPQRLSQFIHLAIRTGNFSDMDLFYEVFCFLDGSKESIKKYIGAGLYIAGKNSLIKKDKEGALRYFSQIAQSCPEDKIMKAIRDLLLEEGLVDESQIFQTAPP